MLFLQITDPAKALATLRGSTVVGRIGENSMLAHIAASTSQQVLRFNAQFKQFKSQGIREGHILATWTNLVLTPTGLRKLGKSEEELALFPDAFREGMPSRAARLGDTGNSGPANWERIVVWDAVDLVLIVASDLPAQVDGEKPEGRVGQYLAQIRALDSGLKFCAPDETPGSTTREAPGILYGATRTDDPGFEHFGFRDGVSQPGIRGVDLPDDPISNPYEGQPGQPLLHPGEFIIGYPRQQPNALPGHMGFNPLPSAVMSGDGPITDPPDASIDPVGSRQKLPAWAKNGSFLVFRRLEQDVLGFRAFVQSQSVKLGISEDLFAAKLVGRYKSGAPLARRMFAGLDHDQVQVFDPGHCSPELAESDTFNNNFIYGDDAVGQVVPLAAHIRKTYPRDQIPLDEKNNPVTEIGGLLKSEDARSRTETHRLLRRGLPYGKSLFAAEGGKPGDKRGLLFLAYQSDIERQFEFVQRMWVLPLNFPRIGAGQDPLITPQHTSAAEGTLSLCPFYRTRSLTDVSDTQVQTIAIQHFVITRGGGYYFSPSIDALKTMLQASDAPAPTD